MHSSADHLNLAPPQPGRWLGPLGLALAVHGLLVAALTWGVGWQREPPALVFEAEIWSREPQAAAPRAAETRPPPRPAAPQPKPQAPTPQPVPAPAPPPPSQADIATAQAKAQAADAARQRERAEAEKKAAAEKTAAANKATAEQARLQQQRAQQQRERERQAEREQEQALTEKELRDAQMRRIMGQAGASGGPTATGSAQRASGPSASYGGRVAARIKPNVVFTEAIAGNPRAEVEVRTLPDGTITARRIVTPSGNPAWDEAVLRAIDRTATLPRDTDGRVPPSLIIGLRPLD